MFKNKGNFQKALEEAKNNKNNAISFIYENKISQNTEGSLADVIFSIKDNYATADASTQASSLSLKNFQPSYNATFLEKVYAEGAIPVFKTHCDELALGGEGIFSYWGIIKNPLDLTRKVGGSSSGAAAAFTKNLGFALGSDTGDSVRLPASYVGVVGFKPSYGAISRYGLFAYASSLDHVAYFTHNVSDALALSEVAYGIDKKDFTTVNIPIKNAQMIQPQKVAFFNLNGFLTPEVFSQYQILKDKLIAENIDVTILEPNIQLLETIKTVYEIISYSEASANLANINGISFANRQKGDSWDEIMTNTRSKGFGYMVQRRLLLGSYFLNKENQQDLFLRAQKVRRLIKEYYEKIHKQFDLIIFPSTPDIAPKFDSKEQWNFMDYILTGANLAGNPSISIPWIKKDNLPVNLTLENGIYEDEKLFSFALWMEKLLGGENE
ncbi:amidase family protein [Mycoplasma iguanae]|uniref:Amidase family protein n=1 Tax=Mycoplasma iguanae TaxID=292461 RepID=A0ABY5R9Q6_9MOLU|nr:amidase family protein [Mycoplasma iguanae]UVD81917.1 amidase family protein [Mycoplasma iguanae]